ncbi:MAG: hypothetical protein M3680_04155 [Myxococcota bacterium]|nr:hypothetical protein [Myxococcota bacterium]
MSKAALIEPEQEHESPTPGVLAEPGVETESGGVAERSRGGLRAGMPAHDTSRHAALDAQPTTPSSQERSRGAMRATFPELDPSRHAALDASDSRGSATAPVASNGPLAQQAQAMEQAPAAPTKEPQPPAPLAGGHGSHEIKLEFGSGSVTGGVTGTLEYGKVGVPVGADQLKAFKNTAAVQLNGLVGKLETAVLNGEMELDVIDGVKVSVEVSALNVSLEGTKAETDLMSVSLKLVGDVGHWLQAGPNVTLTVDGRVSVALGGKLAAKLAKFTVAQLEQKLLAKEIGVIGDTLDKHARAIPDLEAKLKLLEAGPDPVPRGVREQLQREILDHKLQLSTGKRQLEGLTGKLARARQKASAAFKQLEGKLVKNVARAMEQKTVKFVAGKLAKLVPVLNAVSMIIDVVELIGIIRALAKGAYGGSGGTSEDKQGEDAADGGTPKSKGSKASKHPQGGETTPGEPGSGPDKQRTVGDVGNQREPRMQDLEQSLARTRGELSPAARAVVDSVTRRGGPGPELAPDQLAMVGLLVPADLTAEESDAVLAAVRDKPGRVRTADDAIIAIDAAVREVRDRGRTVTVDGVARPDLAGGGAAEGGEGTSSGEGGRHGPITKPSQVDGGGGGGVGASPPAISDALVVVRTLPAAVVGGWFEARNGELVMNAAGTQWIADHQGASIGESSRLEVILTTITDTAHEKWDLAVAFELQENGKRRIVRHTFLVERGGGADGLGAKVGDLKFEPYAVIDL